MFPQLEKNKVNIKELGEFRLAKSFFTDSQQTQQRKLFEILKKWVITRNKCPHFLLRASFDTISELYVRVSTFNLSLLITGPGLDSKRFVMSLIIHTCCNKRVKLCTYISQCSEAQTSNGESRKENTSLTRGEAFKYKNTAGKWPRQLPKR